MFRLLHLSDIHFGILPDDQRTSGQSPSAHYFTTDAGDRPDPTELADLLIGSAGSPPDALAVSGDLAWSALPDDYEYAHAFLLRLRKSWPGTTFVLAPGNHDVDRRPTATGNRQAAFLRFLQEFYGSTFPSCYPLLASAPADRHRLVSFHQVKSADDSLEALILTLNSAASLEDKGTPVHISPLVLRAIDAHVKILNVPTDAVRICVLHHHLLPFAEFGPAGTHRTGSVVDQPDSTILSNSAKLQAWLAKRGFEIVLHGHKHQSHARNDVLWRRTDGSVGRRLLILGAGSAGVHDGQRPKPEPLSFNEVRLVRESPSSCWADIKVKQIAEEDVDFTVTDLYAFRARVGAPPSSRPLVFQGQKMAACHMAMREATEETGLIRNFVSIVEDSAYQHPESARLSGRAATEAEVRESFNVLHPEFAMSNGWQNLAGAKRVLAVGQPPFRFHHGARLFGTLRDSSGRPAPEPPIVRAVSTLLSESPSKAYVGLYDRDLDSRDGDSGPLPGLMGIQFIPDDRYLDAVATFRKLELSFWWCVNMLEIGELLRWAAARSRKRPRRITFFASLAEWKADAEPALIAEIDRLSTREVIALAGGVVADRNGARVRLRRLLEDKSANTSDTNLDSSGLRLMADALDALAFSDSGTVDLLRQSSDQIELAMAQSSSKRDAAVQQGRALVQQILGRL